MRDEIVDLTSRLVAIDSVNPSLIAGGAGEAEIADFLIEWASAAGLEAERLEETPGRPSVLVRARGRGGGRSLLLCAHTDTVGVEGMPEPYRPRIEGDRLYGRGAYDMKAGLAAALVACRSAAELDLAGDVVVAAVADQSSLGVQEALAALPEKPAAAIVTEPTELELVIAHKGFVWSEIEVTGRAAHGSCPDLGIDAIVKSGRILTALGQLDEELAARTHPLLGRGSIHALRNLLVGHDQAVDLLAPGAVRVAPAWVRMQPDHIRGVRPLRAQRRRRAHDEDLGGARRAHRLAGGERLARPPGSPRAGSRRAGAGRGARGTPPATGAARSGRPGALCEVAACAQRLPVRRLGLAPSADRPHMIGTPARPQRLTAHHAAPSRGEEERDPSGGSEATRGLRRERCIAGAGNPYRRLLA
jgi:hypothetical protein